MCTDIGRLGDDAPAENIQQLGVNWYLRESLDHKKKLQVIARPCLKMQNEVYLKMSEEVCTPKLYNSRAQYTSKYEKQLRFFFNGKRTRKYPLYYI